MLNDIKKYMTSEIDIIVGNISGMADLDFEQESFLVDELRSYSLGLIETIMKTTNDLYKKALSEVEKNE